MDYTYSYIPGPPGTQRSKNINEMNEKLNSINSTY